MKRKKAKGPARAKIEKWENPVSAFERIEFLGMVGISQSRFLLGTPSGVFCLTIPARTPYRIVDESYLGKTGKLFATKKKPRLCPTWKIWTSDLLNDLKRTHFFMGLPKTSQFSYFLVTGDECIEFVSTVPEWKAYGSRPIPEIARELLEQDLREMYSK